ncbi:DinB family protein [Rummeliibacillus pycnus]|uniref:DinB family protein n=1 Tax=Rummeliibacillus pycnus TaxID=101070 RepID=UPI0037C9345A
MEFVKSINSKSVITWHTSVAEGKWSTCEIIGHLIPWDRFVIEKRLPYLFIENKELESPNVQEMNSRAALESKGKKKEEVIEEFLEERCNLIRKLNNLSQEVYNQTFTFGKSNLTLASYFDGLIEHDLHHFQQIQDFLNYFEEDTIEKNL